MEIYENEKVAINARKQEIKNNTKSSNEPEANTFAYEGIRLTRDELMECIVLDELLSFLTSYNTVLMLDGTYLEMRKHTGLKPLDHLKEIYFKFPDQEELNLKRTMLNEDIESLSLQGDYQQAAYKKQELATLDNAEKVVNQLTQIDISQKETFEDYIGRIEIDRQKAETEGDYKAASVYKQQIEILKLAIQNIALPLPEKLAFYKDQLDKARNDNNSVGIQMWKYVYSKESKKEKDGISF